MSLPVPQNFAPEIIGAETRLVGQQVSTPLISGAKFFGTGSVNPDPWADDQDPRTTVSRRRSAASTASASATSAFPSAFPSAPTAAPPPAATLYSLPTTSPTAVGPIFHALLSAPSASPPPTASGITRFTYDKDVQIQTGTEEAKTQILDPVPLFLSEPAEFEGFVDSPLEFERRRTLGEVEAEPAELQSVPRRPSSTSWRRSISRQRPNTITTITYVLGTADAKQVLESEGIANVGTEVSTSRCSDLGSAMQSEMESDICASIGTEVSKSKT